MVSSEYILTDYTAQLLDSAFMPYNKLLKTIIQIYEIITSPIILPVQKVGEVFLVANSNYG